MPRPRAQLCVRAAAPTPSKGVRRPPMPMHCSRHFGQLTAPSAENCGEYYYREESEVSAKRTRGMVDGELVLALRSIIEHMASYNVASVIRRPFCCFLTNRASLPKVSVLDEFTRLKSCFRCSNESLVLALVYIDRVVEGMPELAVGSAQLREVFVISIVLAIKYLDDNLYKNSYYANISGIPLSELNSLEALFLKYLGWELAVNAKEYDLYRDLLLAVACYP